MPGELPTTDIYLQHTPNPFIPAHLLYWDMCHGILG
ncbi:hypothetical protein J2X72_004119 [Phyllobacterium sp. 1468]|nr:hypothetical protein [Phyllobacterium sp. 1468]